MKIRLPNGLRVHALNRWDCKLIYHEIFEEKVYLQHGIELREGDRVVDVGANIGLFALFLSQNVRGFTLYAFEPIPATFEVLRRNTSPFAGAVKLFNVGLSSQDGQVVFTHYPRASLWSTCYPDMARGQAVAAKKACLEPGHGRHNGHHGMMGRAREWVRPMVVRGMFFYYESCLREVVCQMRTLSQVISENSVDRIDLLKIDAEGSEWDVLQGIEEGDWEKIKQIVMEVHPIKGGVERISQWLIRRGYEIAIDQEDGFDALDLYMLYARR
jgi:FkbM family methyltransferase